jgi:hypothetical protein
MEWDLLLNIMFITNVNYLFMYSTKSSVNKIPVLIWATLHERNYKLDQSLVKEV